MAARVPSGQIALPLDWSAGGANDGSLVIGTSNADAVRYLRHVATWPVRTAVLTGPRGSGRSLMGRLFARDTGGRVIDGQASVSEEELFHAWNAAQASGSPLLIIADAPPAKWDVALPDLRSRLAAVPVLVIGEPDDCLARDLIEALFAQRGVALAPGVATYIVPRMERSYATIHRVVAALDAASLEQGRRLGVRLARETLLSQGLIDPDLLERDSRSAKAG
ncbi:MAG: HdaA/DnaA family protein [Pseudomonadota bacterium]